MSIDILLRLLREEVSGYWSLIASTRLPVFPSGSGGRVPRPAQAGQRIQDVGGAGPLGIALRTSASTTQSIPLHSIDSGMARAYIYSGPAPTLIRIPKGDRA
jgi:hypothetical protein